jgi:hypothetical protein
MIIHGGNSGDYARYIPVAGAAALKLGLKMNIKPARHLRWSEGFQQATEKYSGQVTLDAEDNIQNYIAGMPFALIEVGDPKAAVKIACNWHMGPFMPDDFSLAPWSVNTYSTDPADARRLRSQPDSDYACEHFDFLRFAHRTEVDPRPTIGDAAQDVEWKAKCNKWIADASGAGTGEGAGIWIRYLDPHRSDEFYGVTGISRRVRRSVNRGYPSESCRGCHQPFWAYALPKTEYYSYKLLGSVPILACIEAASEPAGLKATGGGVALTEEPFEMRHAYVIEMTPRETSPLRTIIFIDSEIYVWLAAEFYGGAERTGTAIPLWRMHPSAEGGGLFDLAGSFYFPSATPGSFRSLVPAHGNFDQKINTGAISESLFNPQLMAH